MSEQALDILKQYWGYEQFRPLQGEIIESVLADNDTLALLPTGGGKSICFQVPALIKEGICVVISPLIALMRDQVANLKERGIAAEAIYSGLRFQDIDRILDNCIYGGIKFLYLSPERLVTDLARERLRQMNISLIAVDEAHCVSQWGYDFRPPYLQIPEFRELLDSTPPILALTATATPQVVTDIQEKLAFRKEQVFQSSFARSNLSYSVFAEENKEARLQKILRGVPGSSVVYVRNRRRTKEIAMLLRQNGFKADYYHAGIPHEDRNKKQTAWTNGSTPIIVSTNAFGMGIDKPDVRSVVHLDLPDSLEAYFQEAGRAGRDGKKSYAVLLYDDSDKEQLLYNYEQSFPSLTEIRRVYQALGSFFQLALGAGVGRSFDFAITEFCKTFKLPIVKTFNCLKELERGGWIVLTESVYTPSTIRFKVGKDKLYEYQIAHKNYDTILKTLLRLHAGVFNHPANIREVKVAEFLKMDAKDLKAALRKFDKEGLLDYRERSDQPQLTYLQDRIDSRDLLLDAKLYNFRKKRQLERIHKVIAYVERAVCRSQQLLAYFGETDTERCGVCDVCTGRTTSKLADNEFERYKQKFELVLKRESLTTEQLLDSFPQKRHPQILEALTFLMNENVIEQVEGKLIWSG